MKTTTKILILEDLKTDLELLARSLKKNLKTNFETKHAPGRPEFLKLLQEYTPDIILSDYSLPSFSGLDALLIAKENHPDIPFIIVTGSVNEETAVNCMKAGASDYVLKENLTRLAPAITSAIDKHRLINAKKEAQDALHKSEKELNAIFNNSPTIMMVISPESKILKINKTGLKLTGRPEGNIIGEAPGFALNCVISPEKEKCRKHEVCKNCRLKNFIDECIESKKQKCQAEVTVTMLKKGKEVTITYIAYLEELSTQPKITYLLTLVDITSRKTTEKKLTESEEKYRVLTDSLPEIVFELDSNWNFRFLNKTAFEKFNVEPATKLNEFKITDLIHQDDAEKLALNLKRFVSGENTSGVDYKFSFPDGSIGYFQVFSSPIIENGKITGIRGIAAEITERKKLEEELAGHREKLEEQVKTRTTELEEQAKRLKESHTALTFLMEDVNEARREVDESNKEIQKLSEAIEQNPSAVVITDTEGNIEYVNQQFYEITGFSAGELIGQNPRILNSKTHPVEFYKNLWDTIKSGKKWNGEIRNRKKDGDIYWDFTSISPLRNRGGEIVNFIAVKEDITEKKMIEQKLKEYTEELELFNKLMVDRELKIIEMKEEVNKLCQELGRRDKYPPIWNDNSDNPKL